MKQFKLELTQSNRTGREVHLVVAATDFDSAQGLAEALAALMPVTTGYHSKSDREVEEVWFGNAEEMP